MWVYGQLSACGTPGPTGGVSSVFKRVLDRDEIGKMAKRLKLHTNEKHNSWKRRNDYIEWLDQDNLVWLDIM